MKQILVNIAWIFLLGFAPKAYSQSLPQLIEEAIKNNYQLTIASNNAQIAKNNDVLGNTGKLPSIILDGGYSTSWNNSEQKLADGTVRTGTAAKNTGFNASAMANWTLFNGFVVHAKQDQLAYLNQMGEMNVKYYLEQTIADITTVYHQLSYELMVLKSYEEILDLSQYRYTLESKRKKLGMSNAIEFGLAKVDYHTDSIRYMSQQNTIESLQIELNRIINTDIDREFAIADPSFTFLPLSPKDSLMAAVQEANVEKKMSQLKELISEAELRISKANQYPKLDLYAGYQYASSTSAVGFVQSNSNSGPIVGVNVQYNLFSGGANRREVKNTDLVAKNTALETQQLDLDIQAQVSKLYQQYLSISNQLDLARANVTEFEKIEKTALEQFKQGAINGFDFREVQENRLNSKLVVNQLEFTLKTIEINLNRLSGNVIGSYFE